MFILPFDELENYESFAFGEKIFSPDECGQILAMLQGGELQQATVGDENRYDPKIRDASHLRLPWSPETDWVFQKLAAAVRKCNQTFYQFQLTGFMEHLEVLRYTPGGFFHWHTDFNARAMSIRKLSVVVQLTDPATYEGGGLEFMTGNEPSPAPKGLGTVVVFPSFVLHRVTPVTSGMRHSLVGWVSGPPFR